MHMCGAILTGLADVAVYFDMWAGMEEMMYFFSILKCHGPIS